MLLNLVVILKRDCFALGLGRGLLDPLWAFIRLEGLFRVRDSDPSLSV